MAGDVCFFWFWKACLATLGDTLFFILGAFGIQNGFQTQVTKLLFFYTKSVSGNAKLDAVFGSWWGGRGLVCHAFGIILDALGSKWGAF